MDSGHICRVISCSKEAIGGTSLHWLPKNDESAKWWLCFLEIANEHYIDWTSGTRLVICNHHFKSVSIPNGSESFGRIHLARGHLPCLMNGTDYTNEIISRLTRVNFSTQNCVASPSFAGPLEQGIPISVEQTTVSRMLIPMTVSQHRHQISVKIRKIERLAKGIEKVTANIRKIIKPARRGRPSKRNASDPNLTPESKKTEIECITIV